MRYHHTRVLVRVAAVATLAALAITCRDLPFEPGMAVRGSLDVSGIMETAQDTPIPIDSLVIELRRTSDSSVVFSSAVSVDSITISADGDTVSVDITVELNESSEEFYLHLAVVGDGEVWFEVHDVVAASVGSEPTVAEISEPIYVGPGANATGVTISLSDTTITGGDSILVTGTAYVDDSPVDGALVWFESSEPSLVPTPGQVGRNQAWVVAPAALTDSVTITAVCPTGTGTITADGRLHFYARPNTMNLVSGNNQEMPVGTVAPESLVVQVVDAAGDPFTHGYAVNFEVASGPSGTSVSPRSTITDDSGLAGTALTAGEAIGAILVNASASGLSGSPVSFSATVIPGAAATMVAHAGDGQTATAGTDVATAPAVQISDENGDPVPDVEVTFTVLSGGGSVSGATATTDSDGIAVAGSWTLGTTAGANTLEASAEGLQPVVFSATGTAGPATSLAIYSGDGQTGAGGAELPTPLVVLVSDQHDNPVGDVEVAWSTSFGSLEPATSQTDTQGLAQSTWTLDPDSTTQTATATVSGLEPVTFTATLSVGATDIAIVDGNDQTAVVATQLPVNPSVEVTDGGGNPVADVQVAFEVASGGGSITGEIATTGAEGIASVGSWTLGEVAGANTLTATVTGLAPVTFAATGMAAAADTVVLVSGNNQTAEAGAELPAPLVIEVQDEYGNVVAGESISWQALNGSVDPTSGTTDASGRAQTVWTLGVNSAAQTASASVGSLAPAVFSATATFPTPSILLSLLGADRIPVGQSATLGITLSAPAGVGGATVTVTSDNPSVIEVEAPGTVTIAEGSSTGQATLNGVAGGNVFVRANATGYQEGSLAVQSSLQVLSMPPTLNVPFGGTASLPISISTPAPSGGETISLISSDPSVATLVTPTVTIPEGLTNANATVSGVAPGTTNINATSATHGSASSTVSTTANLNIVENTLYINEGFGGTITIRLESGGSQIAAPAGGVTVTLTPADPTCVAVTSPVTIPAGLVDVTSDVSYGGSATTPCNSTVAATATDITSDESTVYVDEAPGISMPTGLAATTASGLQRRQTGYLDASNHGGVTVTVTSSDPSLMLVSPDFSTLGSASISIPVADGSSSFSYYLHGLESVTGTATLTATAPGFTDGVTTIEVVQPALELNSVLTSTTSLSAEDPFHVNVGIPYSGNSSVQYDLPVRAGAPNALTATLVSSDPSVGQLVTTSDTGGTVTVEIAELSDNSPTSVAAGGSALDPLAAGTTTISASIPGFVSTTQASSEVTVSEPGIGLTGTTTASGLQRNRTSYLGAPNHGGVDVVLTSADPSVLLLSPDASTAGTASITLPVADGSTGFSYYVQGVEGATGSVNITASAPGFSDSTTTIDVVEPALEINGLSSSATTLAPDDPFYVSVGIPYSGGSSVQTSLAVRAGAPGPLTATIVSSDSAVGHLVTTPLTDDTVTVEIAVGQYYSPTTVASGGVAFDPLTSGATTISASIPGFTPTTQASQDVTVTGQGITLTTYTNASGLQRSASGFLGATNHGGVDVVLTSSDPSVLLLSPDAVTAGTASITIPVADGNTAFSYYTQGVEAATGTVTITATAPGFTDGTATPDVVQPAVETTGLTTTTTSLSNDDPFYAEIGVPYSSNSSVQASLAVRAGAPGPLTVSLTSSVPSVGQLVTSTLSAGSVTVEIAVGQYRSPTTVASGGAAFDPLAAGTTTVDASIPGFISTTQASQGVTVNAPEINLSSTITGSGLQRYRSAFLGASNHGGVDVTVTSSNPSVLLVSPDDTTAGTESIVIPVADGSTGFAYYVQGVEGATGNVAVTASAPGFVDGSATTEVVQPAVEIYYSSLAESFTTLTPDDEFYARVGIPRGDNLQLQTVLDVRAGAPSPLTTTVTSSNPGIGQLVTTPTSGGSVTVEIVAGESNSPTSVVDGGVAFEPLSEGTTTVSVSIPGFITTGYATRTVDVTSTGMTMYESTVGAGLQYESSLRLLGSDHGGVDVVITSSNPSVLLVSPDETTAGTASITVPMADGNVNLTYYVQGVEGQAGTATITAAASGFTDGTTTAEVVQPAITLYSLDATVTTESSDDPFRVQVGVPDATQSYMEDYQDVRAGAPSSHTATVTSSNEAVGQLVTSSITGGSVTVQIAEGEYYSPNSVLEGGVAFDPLTVGSTTVTATIPGFLTLPASGNGSIDVTVSTP